MNKKMRSEIVTYSVVMAVWAVFAVAIINSSTLEAFLFPQTEIQAVDTSALVEQLRP